MEDIELLIQTKEEELKSLPEGENKEKKSNALKAAIEEYRISKIKLLEFEEQQKRQTKLFQHKAKSVSELLDEIHNLEIEILQKNEDEEGFLHERLRKKEKECNEGLNEILKLCHGCKN